ncbi:MAG: serine hydrolase, partial [Thermoanaerobaculia bacterium]
MAQRTESLMNRRPSTGLGWLLLLAPVPPLAADAVDDAVRAAMLDQRIPGLSLAVCERGRAVKAAGYGFANLEHEVPAGPETVY